ncbi:unnamed protein product [Effrenium voratum]|nr:unnamed protein product [Effrenium voratum]
MPRFAAFRALAALALASALKVDEATPAKKVVKMLKKLQSDVAALGQQEEAEFAEYAKFCGKTKDEKAYQIERSGKKISKWQADIDVLAEELKAKQEELSQLQEQKAKLSQQLADATSAREEEQKTYEAGTKEIADAMAALDKARDSVLGAQEELSLATVRRVYELMAAGGSHQLPSAQLAQLEALAAPAPKYKAKSSDVVSMLRGLRSTFVANKQNLEMEEEEAKGAFNKLKMNLEHQIKYTGQHVNEKTLKKSKKASLKAQLEKDKTAETNAQESDTKFLSSLTQDCEDKAAVAAERKAKSEEELAALDTAITKLAAGGVALPQVQSATESAQEVRREEASLSFLQEASTPQSASLAKLKDLEARVQLPELSLAVRAASGAEDPLATVRELIKGMVTKLEDQGKEEASTKAFCDEEVTKSTTDRDKYQAEIETLTSKLETDTATLHQSNKEVALTSVDISKLTSELDEASKLRANESAGNEAALKEAKDGVEAADFALKTLKDFYAAPSFFQQRAVREHAPDRDGKSIADVAPKVNTGDYSADAKQRSSGVLGMLEVLRDDFAGSAAETKAAEEKATEAFDKFKTDSKKDLEGKQQVVDSLTSEISDLKASLLQTQRDLSSAKEGC